MAPPVNVSLKPPSTTGTGIVSSSSSISRLEQISNVDTHSGMPDGAILQYSALTKKWIPTTTITFPSLTIGNVTITKTSLTVNGSSVLTSANLTPQIDSAVATALVSKADVSYVDTGLASKADKTQLTDVESALTTIEQTVTNIQSSIPVLPTDYLKTGDLGITVASLTSGKIPSSQLPAIPSDVTIYDSRSKFPSIGVVDKLYIDGTTKFVFFWNTKINDYSVIGGSTGTTTQLVTKVNGKQGEVVLDKTDIGLSEVDNTSDANKPISTKTQDALDKKVDKSVVGTAASKDVPASGNATTNQVVLGSDSRLTDKRQPLPHQHYFEDLLGKPNTLAGYGITDAALRSHTHGFEELRNVAVENKQIGDVLVWNGVTWSSQPPSTIGLGNGFPGKITLDGIVTGTSTQAGNDVKIATALADTGVTPGTYTKVSVDADGRVVSASNITVNDIPEFDWTKIKTGKPNTIAGYGITDALSTTIIGSPNGVASLDGSGRVPSSQLPSYVDDVMEYPTIGGFPAQGEFGKIYVTVDTGKCYRWSGSTYVEISSGPKNTDEVVEGVTNLYFTTARAKAAIRDIPGNAATADKLNTPRKIELQGLVTGQTTFDGSDDVIIELTPVTSGVIPGTYGSGDTIPVVTVDKYGRVASVSTKSISSVGSAKLDDLSDVDVPAPTNGQVLAYDNGNWVSKTLTQTAPTAIARFDFTRSLEWMVVHGMNTTRFIETLVDSDGNKFSAKVTIVDSNSFKVKLTSARAGHVDVIFG